MFFVAINSRYTNFLLNYNSETQDKLLSWLPTKLSKWKRITAVCILALITLLLLNVYIKAKPTVQKNEIDILFSPLFNALQKVGYERKKSEGPNDFLSRLQTANLDLGSRVEPTLNVYTNIKYGPQDEAAKKSNYCNSMLEPVAWT